MKKHFRPIAVLFIIMAVITGVVYPLVVTGFAQLFFPSQADGSMIEHNGKVIGSKLIGQYFTDPKYFWGRPSATSGSPYTAFDQDRLTGSSGSNLGPLSKTLMNTIQERVNRLKSADPRNVLPIPIDLVTASASGLDPHISVSSAYYQVSRVASGRGLREEDVSSLVDRYVDNRQFGVLGELTVNVLLLNLALDGIQ
jgi:K+-transporting ATPase KdpC subunit